MVGSIAQQYVNDRQQHNKIAKEWTRRYATWSDEKEELWCIKNFLRFFLLVFEEACWNSWHISIIHSTFIQYKVFFLFQNHKEKKQNNVIQTPYPNHAEKNKNKKAIKISYVRGNLQLKSFCFFPQIMSYQCHSHNIELWIELIPFIIITPSFFLSTRSTEPSIKSTVIIACLSLKKKSNYQLTFFKFYIVILLCNITQNIKMYKETVSVQTTAKTVLLYLT